VSVYSALAIYWIQLMPVMSYWKKKKNTEGWTFCPSSNQFWHFPFYSNCVLRRRVGCWSDTVSLATTKHV